MHLTQVQCPAPCMVSQAALGVIPELRAKNKTRAYLSITPKQQEEKCIALLIRRAFLGRF